jgi:hypothetical protein
MAESAVQLALNLAVRIIRRFETLAEADATAARLLALVSNVQYALRDAQNRDYHLGSQLVDNVREKLQKLEDWILRYEQHGNTGQGKGKITRLLDYFHAGKNLEELKRLSQELDEACRCLGLQLNLETCAGIKQIIEQQKIIAAMAFDLVQKHTGGPDDDSLAQKMAGATNIAVTDIKADLSINMAYLRQMEMNVGEILRIVIDIQKLLMRDEANLPGPPPQNFKQCLEMAPFDILEWKERWKGEKSGGMIMLFIFVPSVLYTKYTKFVSQTCCLVFVYQVLHRIMR